MKAKRFLSISALILAVLIIVPSLVACGNTNNQAVETSAAANTQPVAEETTVAETAPVPDMKWNKTLNVLADHSAYTPNFEIVGEDNGDIMSTEVFKRNARIAETYGAEIKDVGTENQKPLELIKAAVDSGDKPFDLVFLVRNDTASAILNGYLCNINNLNYINFENEWYNQTAIKSMEIGGKLFHMVSAFTLVDKVRTNVLYLNRDLATEKNYPDIVQLVRDGNWTLDEMIKYAKGSDINGDSVMDINDEWGVATGGKEAVNVFWNACGNLNVTANKEGELEVTALTEKSLYTLEKLHKLFDKNSCFIGNQLGDYEDYTNTFAAKRLMFCSGMLGNLEKLSQECDFAFTSIPFPKYDTEQKNYITTNDNTYTKTLAVPACCSDFEFTGFMIEVLSWKSLDTTYINYLETICKIKNSYDAVCTEMTSLVLDSIIYDFGLINNVKTKSRVIQATLLDPTKDPTSVYKENEQIIKDHLQQLYDACANNDN